MAYIWHVANYDLHDGTSLAVSHFTRDTLKAFATTLSLHVVLFVMSWIMALVFMVFIFKPFLASIRADGRRVAELLSHLPADMDVEGLLMEALDLKGVPLACWDAV
jgi:hypothetical protein